MLRLLRLPEQVQGWLESGQLSTGHAKALLSLDDPRRILECAQEMMRENYTVRQAEALVARGKGSPAPAASEGMAAADPNLRAAVDSLERALGTKVTIRQRGAGGRIEIHYHSAEERDRIYTGLVHARF
jgi:ParB family chromosome partitioning protein